MSHQNIFIKTNHNHTMENNTSNHTIKFEIKWDGDSLLGLLDGEYSVNVIVVDDSAIELDDHDTVIIKAGVSKAIYNNNDNLEYIFVENVQSQEYEDESSNEISTAALKMINSNENYSEPSGIKSVQNKQSSGNPTKSNPMERCADCGKIVESEVLTQGVCRFCQI